MFTGIVEETGRIEDVTVTEDGRRLRIAGETVLEDVDHGASISVSGVCLTVESYDETSFEVFLASETVAKTYLGDVGVGDVVNLERAMPADGRFDGHVVQGHVDTTATVRSVKSVGEDWQFAFDLPEGYGRYVVEKGSVTIDGISLTVAERDDEGFSVAIVPTTYDLTNLSEKEPGDEVHLEVDVVAKYVENMLDDAAV